MSTQNKRVKQLSKLVKKKNRDLSNQYFVYGKTLVQEAIEAKVVVELFATRDDAIDYKYTYVTNEVMHKLIGDANCTVAALCEKKQSEFEVGNTLILDNVQDPGNVGTMLRSAKAFGFKNILLGEGTADLYNPKVLRAMQGVNFHLNIAQGSIEEYLEHSSNVLITTYLDEESSSFTALDNSSAFDIVFGNEGKGIDPKFKKYEHQNLILDIEYESLNIAIAAGIIMYKIREL